MFSYYGSKSKLINYYPAPKYDTIIEPFAGSARYALKYFDRDVILCDKYEIVARIWKFLQQCSPGDIYGLPDLKQGDKIDREEYDCIEMAWLMGFMIKQGGCTPDLTMSKWGEVNYNRSKKRVAESLFKIKHWTIIHGEYTDLKNIPATWFIDPPYQIAGQRYRHSAKDIDFNTLATWCKSRKGQTIVCESAGANWLPFVPLKRMNGLIRSTTDVIYTNEKTPYNNKQLQLLL
ncbi:hypothetical protein V1389_02030 [Flavobacterium rakeshii]|uniref:hypothetical protein n=1 Tax=Flavobacterium rakeshii TaxID=1038845 RepID=UPI002E7AB7A7|nr:hypothetical protein [Flavobacterium rakeshii]MEE1897095.1 hypothetical protein [Flavobacterium rakeshii]